MSIETGMLKAETPETRRARSLRLMFEGAAVAIIALLVVLVPSSAGGSQVRDSAVAGPSPAATAIAALAAREIAEQRARPLP